MICARILPVLLGSCLLAGCSGNGILASFGQKASEILSSATSHHIKTAPYAAYEDQSYSFQLEVDDIDIPYGDRVSFSIISLPQWLKLSRTGLLEGIPQNSDVGDVDIQVRVTDIGGKSDDASFTITVFNTNDDPFFITDSLPPAIQDEAYEFQLEVDDIDVPYGDALSFRIISGPEWLSLSDDGVLTGTPANADVGKDLLMVELSDTARSTLQKEFDIVVENVNDQPVFLLQSQK